AHRRPARHGKNPVTDSRRNIEAETAAMSTHLKHDEDFDLYALGALEGEEKSAIESHAASCSDCARKLAEARGRISVLSFSAPPVEPSPGVKERLMRQLHATAEGRSQG